MKNLIATFIEFGMAEKGHKVQPSITNNDDAEVVL